MSYLIRKGLDSQIRGLDSLKLNQTAFLITLTGNGCHIEGLISGSVRLLLSEVKIITFP